MKLILGDQRGHGWHDFQVYPNGTEPKPVLSCKKGCLFNLTADPLEMNNLAKKLPDIYTKLNEKLTKYTKDAYQTNCYGQNVDAAKANADAFKQLDANGLYWG